MENENLIPTAPSVSEEDMRRCRETGDYAPVLFEWYKFVGSLNFVVAHIKRDSPAFCSIPSQHYHVLIGLLNRCARLMLSNVALSHEGRFGETTAIIDRCILESAVKIMWLCIDSSQEKFTRYLADGLKTELELRSQIKANIASNDGKVLPIETRMLASIRNHITASELTEKEITSAKKLPDVASMINSLGYGRLFYTIGHKIGSHHVHGTWSSLLFHYLEEQNKSEEFNFAPRGHDCKTHINQYMFVSRIIIRAMTAYVHYAFEETKDAEVFSGLFESTEKEIIRIYTEAVGDDA